MKTIIVTATALEVAPLMDRWNVADLPLGDVVYDHDGPEGTGIVRCGVGMMTTAYYLGRLLSIEKPESMIQIGVAGSFNANLDLGQVVQVSEQQYGDCGVMTGGMLWDIYDLNLAGLNDGPFKDGKLTNPGQPFQAVTNLQQVSGVSVNRITTELEEIDLIRMKYKAEIEVMEGLAFHFSCMTHEIPYMEVRGISNYVGERDKAKWKLEDAVANSNSLLLNSLV